MKQILDLELLRTFVMVARTGELKKAALKVYRSQGAVSMQIKKLEELTGNCLLERSNRGIRLTEAGQTLLSYSEQLLKLSSAALAALSDTDLAGKLSFGIPTDYAQSFLSFFMPILATELPNLEARIICDRSRNLRELISAGELDIAIVAGESEHSDETLLWSERLLWVAPSSARLEEQSPLPIAMYEDSCIVRDLCLTQLKTSGQPYRIVFGSPVLDNIVTAVEEGFAISLLPESLLPGHKTRTLPTDILHSNLVMRMNMISSPGIDTPILRRVSECFQQASISQQKIADKSVSPVKN
ncbi:LysR family transcriptional regulator [Amphritea japonica]|uniref:LysR family transcriptional regulator n=1 Tax=Amphritea japonica ATCC BAA-1530 TaxID=1278309 RepID=A0A7R6PF00_9GAMM|nr:LysR family transcriptional regulator [Amphritea japonica]BBB27011.1 LysR family transcriptional regulator [Amphritea japonica ATCC BAA-1530]